MKNSKKGACSANVQAAKMICLQHNRRNENSKNIPSYVNPHLSHLNHTVFEDDMIKGRASIVPLVKRAELLYTNKTGQKCQKSFTPFREDVLSLPNRGDISDEQILEYIHQIEKKVGWKVVGAWYHKDEGHQRSKYIEGDENFKINYHVHVLYYCQDPETGKSIRPQIPIGKLRQDWCAEATGMERGTPAEETGRRRRSAQQQRIFSQERRIEKLEDIIEEKEQEKNELQHQVGFGAKVGAFFGVGDLAEIRYDKKKAMKALEEEKNREIAAMKDLIEEKNREIADKNAKIEALQDAKDARAEELAIVRKESHQKGYKEAISEVKKAASLRVKENSTAEDIGKAWRKNYDMRLQLEKQVEDEKDKALQRKDPMEKVNQLLDLLNIYRVDNLQEVEEITKRLQKVRNVEEWMSWERNELCHTIIEWGEQKECNIDSPEALQVLRQLFEAMLRAWNALISTARKIASKHPFEAQYKFKVQDMVEGINLQLRFTPGAKYRYTSGWEEALTMGAEKYLAPFEEKIMQEQHLSQQQVEVDDEDYEQEETMAAHRHV